MPEYDEGFFQPEGRTSVRGWSTPAWNPLVKLHHVSSINRLFGWFYLLRGLLCYVMASALPTGGTVFVIFVLRTSRRIGMHPTISLGLVGTGWTRGEDELVLFTVSGLSLYEQTGRIG